MDPNMGRGTSAILELKLDTGVQCNKNVSLMQLTPFNVVQPNPGAFQPQIRHWTLIVRQGCLTGHRKASVQSTVADNCLSLPPDKTWDEVNDPKVDYSGDLGQGKVGHKPRLKPCMTMLVIDPQCNVGLMGQARRRPKSGSSHRCLIMALTGQ